MADVPSVEFDHCRELVLLPGSVFEFTSRFLPPGKLEPVLALYALRQAVCSIPLSRVDDSVKWAKLKWWSEELVADPGAPSRHPVLRALWLSGARARLENAQLFHLVSDAMAQIDVVPDSDENAMLDRLAAFGTTEIRLELALDVADIDSRSLRWLAAATGMFRLISSFALNHQPEVARLPLSVLARHAVSLQQLEQRTSMVELTQIIEHLSAVALDWFSSGLSDLKIRPESAAGQHLQLRWAMEKRRLNSIRQDARGFLETGKRYGPADAWFAWRYLRHLR